MGKRLLVFLLICGFSLSACFVQQPVVADFDVSVSDVYDYEIVTAYVNVFVGKDSASKRGLGVVEKHVSEGSTISYNVTNIDTLGVYWTLTTESVNVSYISEPVFDVSVISGMHTVVTSLPFLYAREFDKAEVDKGAPLMLYSPFLDLDSWANITSNEGLMGYYSSLNPGLTTQISAQNNASGYYLESIFKGPWEITSNVVNIDVILNNQFQLIYDEHGVMQGTHVYLWIAGKYNDKKINIEMEYQLELVGYDLPDFQYVGLVHSTVGFENALLLSILAIGSFVIIPILAKRKKR